MFSCTIQPRLSSQIRPIFSRRYSPRLGGAALHRLLPSYGSRTTSNSSKESPDTLTPGIHAQKHIPLLDTCKENYQPVRQNPEKDTVSPVSSLLQPPNPSIQETLPDSPSRGRPMSEWEQRKATKEAERIKRIEDSFNESSWVKPESPWGFLVYRAVYGKESDEPFQRMLSLLRKSVTDPKTDRTPSTFRPVKVDPNYELTVIEDEERFAGADTHTIRDAFQEWVAGDLPPRVRHPQFAGGIDNIRAVIKSGWNDSDEYVPDRPIHPSVLAPPRWGFCLLVDDFCLRSLDLTIRDPDAPMVKLVTLLYSRGRCENIAEGWADGETDDPQEDVGWVYMYANDYESCYAFLHDPGNWDEEALFMRPSKDDHPLAYYLS